MACSTSRICPWGRVGHPSELFAVGDKDQGHGAEVRSGKRAHFARLKQITPDPWSKVDKKYPEGSQVRGKVVSITDYGAFVEFEQGVEGLVHISQMSWTSASTSVENRQYRGHD